MLNRGLDAFALQLDYGTKDVCTRTEAEVQADDYAGAGQGSRHLRSHPSRRMFVRLDGRDGAGEKKLQNSSTHRLMFIW